MVSQKCIFDILSLFFLLIPWIGVNAWGCVMFNDLSYVSIG